MDLANKTIMIMSGVQHFSLLLRVGMTTPKHYYGSKIAL